MGKLFIACILFCNPAFGYDWQQDQMNWKLGEINRNLEEQNRMIEEQNRMIEEQNRQMELEKQKERNRRMMESFGIKTYY